MEEVGKVAGYAQEYAHTQIELLKLEFAERLSKAVAFLVIVFLLGSIATIVFTLLNVVLGLYLGNLLQNYTLAFLLLAGVYFVFGCSIIFVAQAIIYPSYCFRLFKKVMIHPEVIL
ncbi:MAG: hypothetical protein HC912_10640 [Saprospiraceae bacterium]|nr:hypothetical protein [Saprospiraceae bacterium]